MFWLCSMALSVSEEKNIKRIITENEVVSWPYGLKNAKLINAMELKVQVNFDEHIK